MMRVTDITNFGPLGKLRIEVISIGAVGLMRQKKTFFRRFFYDFRLSAPHEICALCTKNLCPRTPRTQVTCPWKSPPSRRRNTLTVECQRSNQITAHQKFPTVIKTKTDAVTTDSITPSPPLRSGWL